MCDGTGILILIEGQFLLGLSRWILLNRGERELVEP